MPIQQPITIEEMLDWIRPASDLANYSVTPQNPNNIVLHTPIGDYMHLVSLYGPAVEELLLSLIKIRAINQKLTADKTTEVLFSQIFYEQ